MRREVFFIAMVLGYSLTACDGIKQETGTLEENLEDTTAGASKLPGDTTLQPKVEIILRATGNTAEEMAFDQDTVQVAKDALITLSLVNEGTDLTMIHNFVLTTSGKYKEVALAGNKTGASGNYIPDSKHIIAWTPLAKPGQTVTHEFKAPTPGTYDFVCTYPDHWKRMHGKLIVK
ncbi:azurin [Pontibacter sp. KCTC 32443]|uniref:plastocyanin/azurin family copper-binding protein n=1 Tax=Pontibacter TaxID=323449 RepID=UPI00164E5D23|nr:MULTISPECIES: plastocyanin/azurin family copper-binding protein [Pontibacter]MBC5773531.1 azurin [Pontibacter sp. KCTC 32443]